MQIIKFYDIIYIELKNKVLLINKKSERRKDLVKSIEVINNDSLKLNLDTLSVSPRDVIVLHINLDEIDLVDGTNYAKAVQDFFPKNPIMIMPMNDMALQIVKKT